MTTFKEIRGTTIEVVSSDPANPELGQIWYNSSSGTLKGYQLVTLNAWSAGGNLNTGRGIAGTSGTQTAGLIFSPSATESYNGTSWTTSPGSMNTARSSVGSAQAGTQTATLVFGGNPGSSPYVSSATESWNGSSWTTVPATLNTARKTAGRGGTQTAALMFGGSNSPDSTPYQPGIQTTTEQYNGTSWTTIGNLNTGRYDMGSAGIQTSALGFGGYVAGSVFTNKTESYNGTSWTNVANLNTTRRLLAGAGISNTSALAFGGLTTPGAATGSTELWNGSAWTSNPTGLATARHSLSGLGSQSAALAIGGSGTPTATEEWNTTALQVRTITVS
jgi:hypothetical protein